MSALIAAATVYGPAAVAWVTANAYWLVPLGEGALLMIEKYFGN